MAPPDALPEALPDPMLVRAMAAHQAGDFAQAENSYRAFLEKYPDHADAWALLAIAVGARRDFAAAIEYADKAVALDPAAGLLHFQRGTVLMAAQKLPEAIAAFNHAIMLQPDIPHVHFNLANGLRAAGDWAGAIAHYREELMHDDSYPPTYNNLALSLIHEKQYAEAAVLARRAVELKPDFADAWLTLCNVADKVDDFDLALSAGERVTKLMPDNYQSWFGYGLALNRLNRHREAIAVYQRALVLNPTGRDVLDNLGQSYQSLGELEKAEETYRRAITVGGQEIADENTREIDENEYGGLHWHLALMELLRGKYKEGFARYRVRVNKFPLLKRPQHPFPLWKGEDLRGKSLLVYDEQGFGDTLMLARFVPVLRARGAHIVFLVHAALVPLLKEWGGADEVVASDHNKIPLCDYFCSTFDLPHRLGVTLENLNAPFSYLPQLPPDEKTLLPPGPPKIGVVWGGNPQHINDAKRSVQLGLFAELFTVPDVQFFCFTRDLKAGDTALLPRYKIENLIPRLTDFAAAARLIGQMDLVITCDTSTAHLAGALGRKTWILLPFAPDWRWLTGRDDSPWYPSVRLFRQPAGEDWISVIKTVKAELIKTFSRS